MTEREKDAERVLEKREAKIQSIFRAAPVGIGLVSYPDRFLLEVNDRLCEMIGYSAEELVGQSARMIYPADEDFNQVKKNKYAQIESQGTGTVETRWQRKDGVVIEVLLSSTPLDPADYSAGVTFTALDITERKRVDETLQALAQKWQITFDAINDSISLLDDQSRVVQCNRAMTKLLQKPTEEIIGRPCYELMQRAAAPIDQCPSVRAFQTRQRETLTWEIGGRWFDVVADPIIDQKGEITGAVHILSDITERLKAEEQKSALEQQLRQAQKLEAIGTLAGGIAHDFNNILGAVIGFTELARMDIPEGSRIRNDLDQVLKAGLRAKDLVRQILTFSRKGTEASAPINVIPIVKETLKMLRASLPTHIEIRKKMEGGEAVVNSDPTQIQQILINLCANAAQAMGERGGVLEVNLAETFLSLEDLRHDPPRVPGPYLELTVKDTGPGISADIMEHIFEPYFTTKEKGLGTGLGLSVVHGIVQQYGGLIRVQSEPGAGACFRIFLPLLRESAVPPPPIEQTLPVGGEHILVVDDEEALTEILRKTLEYLGYRVTATTDPREAWAIFEKDPISFQLVITDMTMPKLTGDRLVKKILDINPQMPIILCTGYSEHLSDSRARDLGAKALLMKPVELNTLAQKVREILDKN